MAFGSNGAILRVDLTAGTTAVETFDEAFFRRYPGGKALAAYHLLREMPAGADPLGPDNVLVLAAGLLAGAPLSTATRFNAIARSPLTGGFGESEAGGYWGPELKMAGFDAIILTGRSPEPVWLWVKDGTAEIRDGRALWGQDPATVQAAIREAVGEKAARVLQIGRAGENLVPYAMIMNELRHYNGRTGMGAVMGSKNLRAIAVKGSRRYAELAHDPAGAGRDRQAAVEDRHRAPAELGPAHEGDARPHRRAERGRASCRPAISGWDRSSRSRGSASPRSRRSGAARVPATRARSGASPRPPSRAATASPTPTTVRNTRRSPGSGRTARSSTSSSSRAPTSCATSWGSTSSPPRERSPSSWSAWSTACSGRRDLGGLDLRFGNGEAVLEAIPLIADRRGAGELLALGSRQIAAAGGWRLRGLGHAGQGPRARDARAARQGGRRARLCHERGGRGPPRRLPRPDLREPGVRGVQGRDAAGHHGTGRRAGPGRDKVGIWYTGERWNSAEKVLGLCFFGPAPRSFIQVDDVVAAVRAATGWDVTVDELLEIGERAVNIARVFNVREGFDRRDGQAARAPPHAPRGRAADRSLDRPGGVRGGDLRALRAQGLGPGDRRPDARAPGPPRPRMDRDGVGQALRVKVHLWGELGFYGPGKRSRFEFPIDREMPVSDALRLIGVPAADVAVLGAQRRGGPARRPDDHRGRWRQDRLLPADERGLSLPPGPGRRWPGTCLNPRDRAAPRR